MYLFILPPHLSVQLFSLLPFFPGRLSILTTPEESPFCQQLLQKSSVFSSSWLEVHDQPWTGPQTNKATYDLGSSVHHFWFSELHQFGPPGIFLLKDSHNGFFHSDTEYWRLCLESESLKSPSPSLSHFLSAIEQRYIYTRAKSVPLPRPKDSQAWRFFFLLKELEYLDMLSAFLYVPNLFLFLFFILTVDFDSSTITPVPKKGARHRARLQKLCLESTP